MHVSMFPTDFHKKTKMRTQILPSPPAVSITPVFPFVAFAIMKTQDAVEGYRSYNLTARCCTKQRLYSSSLAMCYLTNTCLMSQKTVQEKKKQQKISPAKCRETCLPFSSLNQDTAGSDIYQ